MKKSPTTTYSIEATETRRARRQRTLKDGSVEIFIPRRHARVLKFIGQSVENGRAPTFREIQDGCKYGTPTGARRAVLSLAECGLVETNIRESRSTRLTDEGFKVFEKLRNSAIKVVGPRRVKA